MPEKKANQNVILDTNLQENTNLINSVKQQQTSMTTSRAILNKLVDEFESNTSLDPQTRNRLVERAIHWCLVNGFVVVPKHVHSSDLMCVTYLPFTLFPTPFRRGDFEQVIRLQPEINLLVSSIASSAQLIEKSLDNLTRTDTFVKSLWSIYKKSLKEGFNQKISLTIQRVDYMLHQADTVARPVMKQVEINTIAAGFGYVSTRMSALHRELLKWSNNSHLIERTPLNEPVVKIANGFVEAWRLYDAPKAIVLFVVLDWEINIADQRHLEYEIIRQESQIEIKRCTLSDLYSKGKLDENKTLY